jgi:hypothetical protein
MIRITPFAPADMRAIVAQPSQAQLGVDIDELAASYVRAGNAFTARDADSGRILLVAGARQLWPTYASLWCVLAEGKGAAMVALTRKVSSFIAGLPHARVDATIHADDRRAARWAEMVGLFCETQLAGAMPDGGDAMIFVRRAA